MMKSPEDPLRELERFDSGGRAIRVETFGKEERAPSVIVLHGATGVEYANRFIAGYARSIATRGFVTHLIHYFDRTGTHYADDATIESSSHEWREVVHDAVAFIRQRRPHAAVGVFGFSLGGYLAAAEVVRNEEVGAAVVLAGGLDEDSAQNARRGAPVLILHGANDTHVPVSEARKLEAALARTGHPPVVHLYPGEEHIMSLPGFADVLMRSTEFLRRHLE